VSAPADPRECPYVGLDPFDSAHADYFFGRSRESTIIADHVLARPVTVVYGPSGVGKSSILNVGLPGALKKIAEAEREDADEDEEKDGAPATRGSNFVIRRLRDWQEPERAEQLLTGWATEASSQPIVVILDQFEEYFLYRDQTQRSSLDRALGNLTKRRDVPAHLVIGLRDDALFQLDQLRAFVPSILDTMIELRALSDAGIEDAIRGPIRLYNQNYRQDQTPVTIEDALVKTLIQQLKEGDTHVTKNRSSSGGGRIELPYLQLALIKLWQAEGGSAATVLRETTLTDKAKLGGVGRIVRDHVNGVMAHLKPDEQALCAKMFDRLVTPLGSKIAFPTAALAMPEVVGPNVNPERVENVLNKLTPTEARILKPVTTNGSSGFEIFHDVLGQPVLEWKRDYNARQARIRARWIQGGVFGLMVLLIAALLVELNKGLLQATWREHFVTQPYMRAQVQPHVLSAAAEQALQPGQTFKECAADCPVMVVLPARSFTMGSPPASAGQDGEDDEYPAHTVTIATPFAVSKFELTFADWDACVQYGDCSPNIPDAGWGHGQQPVINVTWNDAQKYVTWFAKVTGKPYRLLTEAEYEYAARGGQQTLYPWGNELSPGGKAMANCNGCGSKWDNNQTAPIGSYTANGFVASFAPNGFGLYDMVGNIWEWVEDCYHDSYNGAPADGSAWTDGGKCTSARRVARGGSWYDSPNYLRSTNRSWWPPAARIQFLGFRVARTLSTP
jgi:formylglycine-generating enzyme required for sulfatase activity